MMISSVSFVGQKVRVQHMCSAWEWECLMHDTIINTFMGKFLAGVLKILVH